MKKLTYNCNIPVSMLAAYFHWPGILPMLARWGEGTQYQIHFNIIGRQKYNNVMTEAFKNTVWVDGWLHL